MSEKKNTDPASDSRAGAREHPQLSTVTERVSYIGHLMSDLTWNRNSSKQLRAELSAAWGVENTTIQNYSSEASRAVLAGVKEDRAEIARMALDALREGLTAQVLFPGDRGAKGAHIKMGLEFAGLDKPDEDKIQRHIVAGIGDATPAKASEFMRGLFGNVTPDEAPVADADHAADAREGSGGIPKRSP